MDSVWDVIIPESQGHWHPKEGSLLGRRRQEAFPAEEAVQSALKGRRREGEDVPGGGQQSPVPVLPECSGGGGSRGPQVGEGKAGRGAEQAACSLLEQQQPGELGS